MEPGIEVAPECIEASRWRRQIELAALLQIGRAHV